MPARSDGDAPDPGRALRGIVADRTWARLTDGTPLITAASHGPGWIVLFHITASPAWSSLPLSGLYVDMLKRLLALSAGTPARDWRGLTSLPPVSLLDGFGHAMAPHGRYRADHRRAISQTPASRRNIRPGLYGAHDVESALNELRATTDDQPLRDWPALQAYGNAHARALEPYLLAAAMLLLLLDALSSLWLRGFIPAADGWARRGLAGVPVAAVPPARADERQ